MLETIVIYFPWLVAVSCEVLRQVYMGSMRQTPLGLSAEAMG